LDSNALAVPSYVNSIELLQAATQIVLVGNRNTAEIKAFLDVLKHHGNAASTIAVVAPGHDFPTDHPAAGKGQVDGRATAYVCHGQSCSLPITEATALTATLAGRAPSDDALGQ
jgi:hypothetical protein